MEIGKEKKLIKNTLIFAIGNVGSKLISFILIPLYTIYMTQSEYGYADLMLVYSNLLIPVISFALYDGILRFLLTEESAKEKIFFTSSVFFICSSSLSLLVAIVLQLTLGGYYLLLAVFLVFQTYVVFLSQFLKGLDKNITYIAISISLSVLILLFTILFLKNMENKILAFFSSQILSYIIVAIIFSARLKIFNYFKIQYFDKKLLRNMLSYSIPLMPNQIMWWIMNASSRIFIVYFWGLSIAGVYAVATKIPSILNIFSSVFLQSWQISAIEESNSEEREAYYSKVFSYLCVFLFLVISILLMSLKFIMKYIVASNFYSSWEYVPLLLFSLLFSNLSQFIGMTYLVSMKTVGSLVTSGIGAGVNFILNLFLIPLIGAQGAAVSSLLSFIMVYLIRKVNTRNVVNIKIDNGLFFSSLLILCIQTVFLYLSIHWFYNVLLFILLVIVCRKKILSLFKSVFLRIKK